MVFRKRRLLCGGFIGKVALFLLLLLLVGLFWIYFDRKNGGFSVFSSLLSDLYAFAQRHSWFLVLSLLFLPTFGVPLSPLSVLAGSCWDLYVAFNVVFVCIGFNLTFSYFFYKKCLNRFLAALIFRNRQIRKPRPNTRLNSIRWCLLVQLIPHLPYSAQCYILATLKEVHFWHYLSISWVVQCIWAVGFICSGKAIVSKHFGLALFCVILLAAYITYRCFCHYRKQGRMNSVDW